MDDKNISVNETQSIGFFSKLQSKPTSITSNEPPKPTPITSNGPPKQTPITSNHPPKQTPTQPIQITSNEQSQEQPQVEEIKGPQVEEIKGPQLEEIKRPQVEEIKVEDVDKNHQDIALDFINKANGVTKNLGHNKLQLQVDELEKQIDKFKSNEKEYEMKINLFKKTISTLQGQLQERSAYITMMDKQHIDPQYEKQIEDLKQIINERDMLLSDKNQEIVEVVRRVDILNVNLQNLSAEKEYLNQQTNDAKKHYASLETHHQRQSVQLQVSDETINKLQNKIILEENLKTSLQKELSDMKDELVKYRTDIKNMTIQKDYEIDNLKKQIETLNENFVKENNQSTSNKKITIDKIDGTPLQRRDPITRSRLPTNGLSRRRMPI
jgi:chromosome segregation ATPase